MELGSPRVLKEATVLELVGSSFFWRQLWQLLHCCRCLQHIPVWLAEHSLRTSHSVLVNQWPAKRAGSSALELDLGHPPQYYRPQEHCIYKRFLCKLFSSCPLTITITQKFLETNLFLRVPRFPMLQKHQSQLHKFCLQNNFCCQGTITIT